MPAEPTAAPLRVLLLEESDADAALLTARLEQDGFAPEVTRARRLDDFTEACRQGRCEIILAEFKLPAWDGWQALDVARRFCPTVPFIFVSGVAGEDLAVDSLHHGAAGFVAKQRLTRLAPAVHRALAGRGLPAPPTDVGSRTPQDEFLRLIDANVRDVICLHSADGTIRYASPAVRALLGFEPEEWVGHRAREFIHPEDADQTVREMAELVASGRPRQAFIMRLRHKAGHHVWVEVVTDPVYDSNGRVTRFISVSRDCSERRRVEDGIRRSERLHEGIAEANRLLLTADRMLQALPAVLRALGEASGSDRVAVFEFAAHSRTGLLAMALRAEWVRDPAFSLFRDPRMVELALAELGEASAAQRVSAGEPVVETQASLAVGGERKLLQEQGVRSALYFPIMVGARVWGKISFAQILRERVWTAAERAALGTLAANIGQEKAREQAVAALAESERRYEALLAGLSEGVFHIDLEARWRFLNSTWQALTGHTVAESLGRRFSDFLVEEDAGAALEGFGRLVSGRNDRLEVEVRFRHRRGDGVWLRIVARPHTDETGRIVGVSGTLMDVTQRRLAQEAVKASERKFAAVFASAFDAILLVDTSANVVVECNPRSAEMFERAEPRELVGTDVAALLRRPFSAAERADSDLRLARGEVWRREVECITARGRTFWGQLAIARMAPESLGTTLVRVADITELKRSEERLRSSLAEKEVLLKEVYHRVKNNLQIISALLRMQTRRVKDPDALVALENSISRVMAMAMVHEKLYQAQNLVSIDFLSFAQSLVVFLNQLTAGSRAPVRIEVAGEPLALSIDHAIPLGLVLNELVTNSIKYAFPEGVAGHIGIRIGREGARAARVSVADDGVGLPAGVDLETSGGLGFRIVRMLVEQLQGTFEIQSRGGLEVTVHVPLPEERPGGEPPA